MTILLTLHIIFATVLTVAIVPLLIAAIIKKAAHFLMISSKTAFLATATSGVLLVAAKPSSLTHFCAVMTVYTVLTLAVISLYNKRVPIVATETV